MNRTSKGFLVAGLLAVVGMAFRVSWNALRDVSHAIGADPTAAAVYPLVVDGLMALALVATLVLPDSTDSKGKSPRGFALRVLAGYTAASLVLNYVHGLVPQIQDGSRVRLADWSPANWALVLLATSLPVGSIFFGSDLVAKVLHHKPTPQEPSQTLVKGSVPDLEQSADPAPATSGSLLDPTPAPALDAPTPVAEPSAEPVRVAAASTGRPRRATGTVPTAARSKRPTRTPSELLAEAKTVTADWPDNRLTADHIREAVRTSSVNARALRDALKAERANRAGLHAVPDAAPTTDAAPGVA
jgi:hypothetical protein